MLNCERCWYHEAYLDLLEDAKRASRLEKEIEEMRTQIKKALDALNRGDFVSCGELLSFILSKKEGEK